jgi:hypothetical protein
MVSWVIADGNRCPLANPPEFPFQGFNYNKLMHAMYAVVSQGYSSDVFYNMPSCCVDHVKHSVG